MQKQRIIHPMTNLREKICTFLCLWTLLLSTGTAFGQYSGRAKRDRIRISVGYIDGRPKARGYLLEVSDSGLTAVVKIPTHTASARSRQQIKLWDTLSIASLEIARLRIGSKAHKRRVMKTSILGLMAVSGIVGYVVGVQSDATFFSPGAVGILGAVALAGLGFEAGIPLGFILNDLTKKTHRINGNAETFWKIAPELQRY
jgi:hypothetical protein